MSKKKTGAMPTNPPKEKKKMVINMTKVELEKAYQSVDFKTGKYMSEKDRPRRKNWKREYDNNGKESGGSNSTDSFLTIWKEKNGKSE